MWSLCPKALRLKKAPITKYQFLLCYYILGWSTTSNSLCIIQKRTILFWHCSFFDNAQWWQNQEAYSLPNNSAFIRFPNFDMENSIFTLSVPKNIFVVPPLLNMLIALLAVDFSNNNKIKIYILCLVTLLTWKLRPQRSHVKGL